jgi:sulfane dehydrogenase subunit SoxC
MDILHRRRFLKGGLLAATGALVPSVASGQGQAPPYKAPPYGIPSRFEKVTRVDNVYGGESYRTPLQDLRGIITPSPLHFNIPHGSPVPEIDPEQHRLMIHGMVERPLVFTVAEIKRLPSVSRILFLQCPGNSYATLHHRKVAKTVQDSHGWTSTSEWTGVLLSVLLNEVGIDRNATWLIGEGAERNKHAASIPLGRALEDGMVVYAQNGEAIRPEQGYPLRLLVPGTEGMRNIKYLRRLKLTDEPTYNQWEIVTYTQRHPDGRRRWLNWELPPNSVITFPSGEQRLQGAGFYEISGIAWTGGGTVHRVQVSTDGARTWQDAQLQEPVLRYAHTRFRMPWNWDGRETVIQSRCIDEWGHVQPTLREWEQTLGVGPDYWLRTEKLQEHFHASQPWRITPDGRVHNAMFT